MVLLLGVVRNRRQLFAGVAEWFGVAVHWVLRGAVGLGRNWDFRQLAAGVGQWVGVGGMVLLGGVIQLAASHGGKSITAATVPTGQKQLVIQQSGDGAAHA